MSDCSQIRDLLVLDAEGELDSAQSDMVRQHLQACESCSAEANGILEVRNLLLEPGLFAPVEDESWNSLAARCAGMAGPSRKIRTFSTNKLSWNLQSSVRWALPLAACLVLGLALVWMMRNSGKPIEITSSHPPSVDVAPGNAAFLERIDQELMTRSTARYLAECQDLLVELLKADRSCSGKGYDMSREIVRARELLQKRRIMEAELSAPEIAQAKDLCDDLENLLVSLSLSRDCESPEKFRRMEGMIEKERLLLRIRLIQSDIS